jgi:hypothetical protein
VLSDTTPQRGQLLTAITTSIADADGLGPFTYRWQRTAAIGLVSTFTNITGATSSSFLVPSTAGTTGRRYRVIVSFTDQAGHAESRTSAASARTTAGPNILALQATGLTANTAAPLVLGANVPTGAQAAEIAVFAMPTVTTPLTNRRAKQPANKLVSRVQRRTPKAGRYTFRLTERALRNLKPGRYRVELRVGTDTKHLGRPVARIVTVKRSGRRS